VYLTREEIQRRVVELGAELAEAFAGRGPLLVAPLKSSVVFLADLSRALPIPHGLDFLELAAYGRGNDGGVRLLKDLDTSIVGRHVLVVEDVVDTGLTLHFLARTLSLREPASLTAVTLLDRPYRRLVDDVPSRTSASRCPTSSSRATGSGSTSAGGRSPTSTSSPPRSFPRTSPATPTARAPRETALRPPRGRPERGSEER
jgi:hypoxanthine phosphoribosyltransferase